MRDNVLLWFEKAGFNKVELYTVYSDQEVNNKKDFKDRIKQLEELGFVWRINKKNNTKK